MVDMVQKDSSAISASDETLNIAPRAMFPSRLSALDGMSHKDSNASDETMDSFVEIPEHQIVQVENGGSMCNAVSAGDESPRETRTWMRTRLKRARQHWQAVHEKAYFSDSSLLDSLFWSCAHHVP